VSRTLWRRAKDRGQGEIQQAADSGQQAEEKRRRSKEDRGKIVNLRFEIADWGFEKAQVILRNTPPTT
jgi:hypothetical protein